MQPRLERALRRIILETLDALGHPNDRLLHDVLGFGFVQAGLERSAVNEPGINLIEILPALLVVPMLKPA
jgi:hypothetical protein